MDFEKMKKEYESKKESREFLDEILDFMATTTGDKHLILGNKFNKLQQKLKPICMSLDDFKLKENFVEKLTNILDQFNSIIDDFIKENEIEME